MTLKMRMGIIIPFTRHLRECWATGTTSAIASITGARTRRSYSVKNTSCLSWIRGIKRKKGNDIRYYNVYFRIRSTLRGIDERDQDKQLKQEAWHLFLAEGWTLKEGRLNCSDEAFLGKQSLYLHPMNFSGVVADISIPEILELLEGARTFECYHHDQYDEYFDMSDEQYDAYLETQREAIWAAFMEKLKTKRCNLYCYSWDIITPISAHFRKKRIKKESNYTDRERKFAASILDEMVKAGYIKTAELKQGMGYRAANAKELAALKKELVC